MKQTFAPLLLGAAACAVLALAACSSSTGHSGSGSASNGPSSTPASSAAPASVGSASVGSGGVSFSIGATQGGESGPSASGHSGGSGGGTGGGGTGGGGTGGGGTGGSGTGGGGTGGHSSSHPSSPSSSSSAPTEDHAELTSFEGSANCTNRTDPGTVTLTWTSKGGANAAYIVESQVAIGGSDGEGSSPKLPANGSTTMPFDCRQDYDYFTIYVHAATTKNGETLQVANNIPA
jgi:hypothetical protein